MSRSPNCGESEIMVLHQDATAEIVLRPILFLPKVIFIQKRCRYI